MPHKEHNDKLKSMKDVVGVECKFSNSSKSYLYLCSKYIAKKLSIGDSVITISATGKLNNLEVASISKELILPKRIPYALACIVGIAKE